ncbi:MAG: serine/threonine protein kinase [Myxococcales bacterium]|nr:serine/threonine protein kinase [Myxococcales bacterium]
MALSSDTWAALRRPEAPFLRLLEDAAEPAPWTPSPVLGGRFALMTREAGPPPVERWVAQQSFGSGLSRMVRVRCVSDRAPDADAWRAALLDEAAALAALDHPGVVQLVDVVEDGHRLGVVREYVDGVALSDVLRRCEGAGAGVPFELAIQLASEILWVLDALHSSTDGQGRSLGLVHRGLHPDHVRITRRGHVKLDGFELARMNHVRRPATEPGLVKGFAAYLPPEVIAGEPASPAADQYAVGVMLYELLTGAPCFTGATAADVLWKVVREGPELERLEACHVPLELRDVVAIATQPSPEDRFEGAAQMARALDDYAEVIRRLGRPWRLASYLAGQALYPSPVVEAFSEASTAVVPRDLAAAPVSEGLAQAVEVTEVEDRDAMWSGPEILVDVSDLDLVEEPELVPDDEVVLIGVE